MESHKLSAKRILIDLLSIKDQLKMLFNNNTEYATLINFLTEKDYYNDDDIPLPTLKEIESKTLRSIFTSEFLLVFNCHFKENRPKTNHNRRQFN